VVIGNFKVDRLVKGLALLSVPLPWAMACLAAEAGNAVPSAQGPQIMFYFKQPIGSTAATRVYGLRIDQASTPPALPGAAGIGSLGRRELVNLQINAHANVKIDFARRLSWDFGRRQFNLSGDQSDMAVRLPSRAFATAGSVRAAP
jgi:hypothetical protein